MSRKDDSENQLVYTYPRTDRMFKTNGNWFFRTREGTLEGPYMDEWEAKTWVDLYVSFIDSGLPLIKNQPLLEPTKLEKTR